MLLGLFEGRQLVKLKRLAVDPKAHIALRLHIGKHVQKLAFFFACQGRQNHQPGIQGERQHGVHHLAHGLGLQRQVVFRAKRRAGAGKQQAQVVVNLGHRADRGARVVRGGLLLDRDRRREALDQVHIGLVHELQKLARVGG